MVRVAFFTKGAATAEPPLAIIHSIDGILLKRHVDEMAFAVSRANPLLEGRVLTVEVGTADDGMLQLSGACGDTRIATLTVDPLSVDVTEIGRAFTRRRPDLPHERVVFALLPDEEQRS